MTSDAKSPEEYIASLPSDRKEAIIQLRKTINSNLPKGFKETMNYGMIGYVVPHSLYPDGYHCTPELPLPFMSLASQKNYIALYHSGIYADEDLQAWFVREYPKYVSTKLDMGKSCVRFKKPENIPYELIAELCTKMSVEDWIALYEKNIKKTT
ncbi:MAG: DUF1801 domain-containing protein [Flavobacteriaceae bacterium]|nr:DUF1801 domain-containing protein [Muriicola sp.]NNC61266.1 DUF1801 domain-containing protein [Eudoraea sp.]NNK21273.1 DUF1801 domain-containing protein [Flavobacteriaceae bacterium]MBT8291544.1 DUF1801 domain-containing protein [Muriicola sp.]NNK36748.1 DUF1801 domain-containing protein [Eudoraea sp.]